LPIITVFCCSELRSLTPHSASMATLDTLDAGVMERSSMIVYVAVQIKELFVN
jgi:hypothetical protein